MESKKAQRELFQAALLEDVGGGDVTSRLLIPAGALGKAFVTARESGIFYGVKETEEIFRILDRKVKIRFLIKDGGSFKSGKVLFELSGPVRSILEGERTALNFLGHLCGVATRTNAFAKAVRKYGVRILDTRKTTPLLRDLEKKAVLAGGGMNHRMGLYDEIFVKENHRRYGHLEKLQRYARKFEMEVRNLKEAAEAARLKPRVILFDNFTPAALKKAVVFVRNHDPKIILEASGGITLENVRAFAATGVDWISTGSLTHSVRSIDLSLLIKD
jgi:nicotinate-nucleotide pyrophosphorylase (carboxylating)